MNEKLALIANEIIEYSDGLATPEPRELTY